MKWRGCSQIFSALLAATLLCSIVQVDGRIRRRRQFTYTNYGSVALDPAVASYYSLSGAGSYTGNNAQPNRFIVGGVAYQYPTPVNVMSGGSYNPQQYNAYPSGSDGNYYGNMNNMRLPSPDGWYAGGYYQRYPMWPMFNDARRHAGWSFSARLLSLVCVCLSYVAIL